MTRMRCDNCGQNLTGADRKCPKCGEPSAKKPAGMLKTSTILIATENIEGVYHSMQEVPEPLRRKLLKTTNGLNARTILIADRRGRQEIARLMKRLPGAAQRRLSQSLLSGKPPFSAPKLSGAQAVGILLAGAAGVQI